MKKIKHPYKLASSMSGTKQQRPGAIIRKMAAGGSAAVCVRTMEAPLERVKLLLQNQNMIGNKHSSYNGIFDALRRVHDACAAPLASALPRRKRQHLHACSSAHA